MSKKALCIGINDYPGTQNDLKGCVNDANDWAAELKSRGCDVGVMLNGDATRAGMTQAMNEMITSARSGDTVIFTYSGHGTWVPDSSGDEPDGRDEALCPCDIGMAGPLIDDEIHALFDKRANGVRILLISDSCHSGSVTRGDESDLDPGMPRARFMPPQDWMHKSELPVSPHRPKTLVNGLKKTGGDLLLAGCLDTEYSYDTSFHGRPNGAFTYYAVKTLHDSNPATYDAWFKAIRDYLPNSNLPQNPQILGSAGARRFKVLA
ncbi:MAG: caspase family protein [Thiobacillaceae bacterium]